MTALIVLIALIVGFAAYVRLAPSDPARWHVPVTASANKDMEGGVIRVLDGQANRLSDLDAILRAAPRTRHLAGSVADGRVTYVTRTRVWGFPDYTTIEARGNDLLIFGRLRFGRSDIGVNKARVTGWLDALAQGGA